MASTVSCSTRASCRCCASSSLARRSASCARPTSSMRSAACAMARSIQAPSTPHAAHPAAVATATARRSCDHAATIQIMPSTVAASAVTSSRPRWLHHERDRDRRGGDAAEDRHRGRGRGVDHGCGAEHHHDGHRARHHAERREEGAASGVHADEHGDDHAEHGGHGEFDRRRCAGNEQADAGRRTAPTKPVTRARRRRSRSRSLWMRFTPPPRRVRHLGTRVPPFETVAESARRRVSGARPGRAGARAVRRRGGRAGRRRRRRAR